MLKHEGIPVKLMAGIPFCRKIIHQEIKVKKTIILTLLLITALVANGCGNKKNVTDMKDKETTCLSGTTGNNTVKNTGDNYWTDNGF